MQTSQTDPGARPHRVLVADDHEPTLRMLEALLRHGLDTDVITTTDPERILSMVRDYEPDMLLLDLHMPGLDGLSVARQVAAGLEEGEFLPIVMFSGDATPLARQQALALGAHDFFTKPIVASEVRLRLENLLRLRELTCRLEREVQDRVRELRNAEFDMASRLALVAELRDYPDGAHVQRVGTLSALIARQLGMGDDDVTIIRFAAPLHDIGKIAVPDSILLKRGGLTAEEREQVKAHTTNGARLLAGSQSPILRVAEEIALSHHDHWDGSGYTAGLAGANIPVAGRIVAVADVFDALTHARPYKERWTIDEAMTWMDSMRAKKFDPAILDALLAILGDDRLPPGDDAVVGPAIITAGANRDGMITSRTLPRIRGIYWPA